MSERPLPKRVYLTEGEEHHYITRERIRRFWVNLRKPTRPGKVYYCEPEWKEWDGES